MTQVSVPQNPRRQRAGTSPGRIVLLGAAVVLGVTALAGLGGACSPAPDAARQTGSHTQASEGAQTAIVRLQFGAGNLSLAALETADGTLARMNFEGPAALRPEASYSVRNGVGDLGYTSRDADEVWQNFPVIGRARDHADLRVQLARNVTLALDVEAGAADSTLDLTQLHVSRLDLETGASDTLVRLPQTAGSTVVVVRAGVAELDIEVPTGVAADIVITTGLGGRHIDTARFQSLGNGRYRSPEYATATNRVEMRLELGIGDLSVR
jgi:hypothetical protein